MNNDRTVSKDDKRIFIMSEEKPARAVIRMGMPVTMGMLFMVVYNITDTYFIGLLDNYYQLAAANLAYPVMMIMIALAGIVGNGGASYIARCIGADDIKNAEHTLTTGFELILVCSALFTAAGLIFLTPAVKLLGADADTFGYTRDYVEVLFLGSVFSMGNYAIGQLLRSEGSTGYSMIGMIAGNVINMILDPLFIFTLGLEIKGAAIATVIGNAAGMFIFIYFYAGKKTLLSPSLRYLKMDGKIIKEIFLVGTPHTLEQLFSASAMLVNNNLVSKYTPVTVAAMGVSNKVMSFGNYVYQGMAAGSQPLMGYNYGAKNYKRMKSLFTAGIAVITCIELCVMLLYGFGGRLLVGLFSESREVVDTGVRTLHAAMLMLPFVGTTSLARNTFNSIGKPMYAFGITVVRQLILYIPFLLVFDSLWGYGGLIHAQPAEEALCMVLSSFLIFSHIKKLDEN